MTDLYTKSGRLLQRVDNHIYSRSGRYLGQVENQKIFNPDGRYCGTVVGDRVVYRTIDSAAAGAASLSAAYAASTQANRKGSPLWGVEPPFDD
ncbi:MAG: hypothetical protein DI570_25285 [Phenylobacterium zucineum]|nr:MAG: hypothetical protein DI570_25285 [Phenylobacterium zucineum]